MCVASTLLTTKSNKRGGEWTTKNCFTKRVTLNRVLHEETCQQLINDNSLQIVLQVYLHSGR